MGGTRIPGVIQAPSLPAVIVKYCSLDISIPYCFRYYYSQSTQCLIITVKAVNNGEELVML